jgi:transposase
MACFDLTDFEWSVIQPLLPNKPRGVPRVDDRRVLNGIFWRLRTGGAGAAIPERYGPHTTRVNRFNRGRRAGVWDRLLEAVSLVVQILHLVAGPGGRCRPIAGVIPNDARTPGRLDNYAGEPTLSGPTSPSTTEAKRTDVRDTSRPSNPGAPQGRPIWPWTSGSR